MIRWANILQLVGFLILGLAVCLGISLLIGIIGADGGIPPLMKATGVTAILGTLLTLIFRPESQELSHREATLLVVLSWILIAILGGLPFCFSTHFPSLTDAFFESVSGFSTTGSSILSDIEALPDSLLFWRHFIQWLGGMGIILLMIAILPLLGTGGLALYRAEFSGARSEKLKARVAETALALWKVYVGFTVAGYVVLRLAGMKPLDAVCHTFTSLSTGGFSTRNISVESFHSLTIEIVLVVLMIIGATNFTLHYRVWVDGDVRRFVTDPEIRFYYPALVLVWLVVTLDRLTSVNLYQAARESMFNVTSIATTTGYASADFGQWSPLSQLILLASMYAGGCTGSTCGGFKSARVVLLAKVVCRQFRQIVDRREVRAVRFGSDALDQRTIRSLLSLVLLALLVDFVASLLLTMMGLDIITSISAVAATMFGVGPGLAQVGPGTNFGHLPTLAKWVLIFCMLAGRLEFYAFLVVFTVPFWRK